MRRKPAALPQTFGVERLQHRERAQREAGVVQVGAALAAGEPAVGVLRFEEVRRVPLAHVRGQPLDAVEQPDRQSREVRFGLGHASRLQLRADVGGNLERFDAGPARVSRQNTAVIRPTASGSPCWFVKSNR